MSFANVLSDVRAWLSAADHHSAICTKYSLLTLAHAISYRESVLVELLHRIKMKRESRNLSPLPMTKVKFRTKRQKMKSLAQTHLKQSPSSSRQLRFTDLPNELLLTVISFLGMHDKMSLSLVCHRLYDLCRSPILWAQPLPFVLDNESIKYIEKANYLSAARSLQIIGKKAAPFVAGVERTQRRRGRSLESEMMTELHSDSLFDDDYTLDTASKLFPDLESLQFYSFSSKGASLNKLSKFKQLREIELGITNLSDGVLQNAFRCENNRRNNEMDEEKETVSDEKGDLSSHSPNTLTENAFSTEMIQTLTLDRAHISLSSPSIDLFSSSFAKLTKLSLYCCDSLSGSSLETVLSQLTNLRSFCFVSPDSLIELDGLAFLSPLCEELCVDTKNKVPQQTLEIVLKNCVSLNSLSLCPFSPKYCKTLSLCASKSISILHLQHYNETSVRNDPLALFFEESDKYPMSSEAIVSLFSAKFLPSLKELSLGNLCGLDNTVVLEQLFTLTPKLERLFLGFLTFQTPSLLRALSKSTTALNALTFRRCSFPTKFTPELINDIDLLRFERRFDDPKSDNEDPFVYFAKSLPQTLSMFGLTGYRKEDIRGHVLLQFPLYSSASFVDFTGSTTLSEFRHKERQMLERLVTRKENAVTRLVLSGCRLPPQICTLIDYLTYFHFLEEDLQKELDSKN